MDMLLIAIRPSHERHPHGQTLRLGAQDERENRCQARGRIGHATKTQIPGISQRLY